MAWLAVGTTSGNSPYQLQEFVEGTALTDAPTIDLALAEQLVEICETQRGLVDDGGSSWSGYVRGVVFQGCAASSYASIAAFVRERSPTSLPRVHQGGARLLHLLENS